MKLKKSSILLICLMFVFLLSGIANAEIVEISPEDLEDEDLTLGFAQKTQDAPYFQAQVSHAEEWADEHGVELITTDADDDAVQQMDDMDDLLVRDVDGMIINPDDPETLIPATERAAEEGVPLVVVDSDIDEAAEYVTKVTSANRENGELVGRWLVNNFDEYLDEESMNVALISGTRGNVVGRTRRMGFFSGVVEEQLQQFGEADFRILSQGWGDWQQDLGMEAMQDIAVGFPDVNVIIGENDSMAIGASMAMQAQGYEPMEDYIVAATADGQREALEMIMDGEYGATGLNSPEEVTVTGLEIVASVVTGLSEPADFPDHVETEAVAISAENVEEYYDPDAIF